MGMKKTLFTGLLILAVTSGLSVDSINAADNTLSIEKEIANNQVVNCSKLKMTPGEEDADMGGKRYLKFVFTNISDQPCTLKGFPTFVVLNKAGKSMKGVSYTNDFPNGPTEENRKPKLVTLEPGKTAWFQVYYNDGMALDHKKPYPKAYKFMITAPRGDKAFVMRTDIAPCCGVQVSSIQAEVSE